MINNIYLHQGDNHGQLIDILDIIESEDNLKLYASVWEVDDDSKTVLIRNGKVVIRKELLSTLLRLCVQHGTSRSLAYAQKLVHIQVLTKMNEDRPYFRQMHGKSQG